MTMTARLTIVRTLFLIVGMTLAMLPGGASAGILDPYKSNGWVGERPDGLAGVVTASAPAEAKAAVERVNAERMVEYNRIAAQQKTSVAAVQAIFGKKLIDQAAKGTYIMNAQGQWVKK
jgi:uncharacterized protein YdbL (DUF1318 family)